MFRNPEILWMLLSIPILVTLYVLWGMAIRYARLKLASKDTQNVVLRSEPLFMGYLRALLIVTAIALFILGLARPQGESESIDIETEGIDIVLAIDISKSMLAMDFKPNRLDFLKRKVRDFITKSRGDRFAIVAFAGSAYVHMPMTADKTTALTFVDRLNVNNEIPQGTAVGDAISLAVERFIADKENARVVVLFTDGESNKGVSPLDAAKSAQDKGVVIFPIGIGSTEGSYIPDFVDLFGRVHYKTDKNGQTVLSKLDENTLKKIASTTGGSYYYAADPEQLRHIYTQLDRSIMQTYKSRQVGRKQELAPLFLFAGLILLFIEAGLKYLTPSPTPRKSGRYVFER